MNYLDTYNLWKSKQLEDPDLIARPALHAYALALTHPVTGAHLYFTAPTPADMEKLI